jgi:hypothetical protein
VYAARLALCTAVSPQAHWPPPLHHCPLRPLRLPPAEHLIFVLNLLNTTAQLLLPCFIILHTKAELLPGFALTMAVCVLWLKLVSYAHVNWDYRWVLGMGAWFKSGWVAGRAGPFFWRYDSIARRGGLACIPPLGSWAGVIHRLAAFQTGWLRGCPSWPAGWRGGGARCARGSAGAGAFRRGWRWRFATQRTLRCATWPTLWRRLRCATSPPTRAGGGGCWAAMAAGMLAVKCSVCWLPVCPGPLLTLAGGACQLYLPASQPP